MVEHYPNYQDFNDLVELINDSESDFDNWVDCIGGEGGDQFASIHIYNKICELKEIIRKKAL